MNKHFLLGLFLIIISLASCSKREIELDEADPTMIKAITEKLIEASATSKSEKEVLWNPGDEIAVFSGELSGKFESTLKKKPSSAAVFRGDLGLEAWPEEMDIWAVYPYSEEAFFDGETITTVLPSEQIARDGEFGKDMNLAIAHSNTSILQFYNVGGGIRFSVTEEGIKKVMFEGLGGEIISGKVEIGFDEDGLPEIRKVVKGSQFITILPPDGQETFQKDTWYYIVVIPGSLDRGYKLRFYKDSDYARKVSNNSMKIKRNFYRDLENADDGIEYDATMTHFPETEEEWNESIKISERISNQTEGIIDYSLSTTGEIEVSSIISEFNDIEGVDSAFEGASDNLIIIKQTDGVYLNVLLNRLTEEEHDDLYLSVYAKAPLKSNRVINIPSGKSALILAPFQKKFHDYLNNLRVYLESTGFSVSIFEDEEADLSKFRGAFLKNFDVIYIATHGSASGMTTEGKATKSIMATGTKYRPLNKNIGNYYSDQVVVISYGLLRYSVTTQILEDVEFNDSFVLLGVCQSSGFANAFKEKKAGVAIGFTKDIDNKLALTYADWLFHGLSNGLSVSEAHDKIILSLKAENYNSWASFIEKRTRIFSNSDLPFLIFDPTPFGLSSVVDGDRITLLWEVNPSYESMLSYKVLIKDDELEVPQSIVNHGTFYYTAPSSGYYEWSVIAINEMNDSFQSDVDHFTVTEYKIRVESISLNKTDLELNVGNTSMLKATILPSNATNKNVIWYSSNSSVATVSSAGEIKGVAKGTATITVKTEDGGKTATCRVTVIETKVPVSGVSLNKSSLSMAVGDTQTLTTIVTPSNATDKSVTWSSSNTSVATVSSSGVVTAKKSGTAVITVKTNDGGKKATCNVTVKETSVGGDIEGTERDSWN